MISVSSSWIVAHKKAILVETKVRLYFTSVSPNKVYYNDNILSLSFHNKVSLLNDELPENTMTLELKMDRDEFLTLRSGGYFKKGNTIRCDIGYAYSSSLTYYTIGYYYITDVQSKIGENKITIEAGNKLELYKYNFDRTTLCRLPYYSSTTQQPTLETAVIVMQRIITTNYSYQVDFPTDKANSNLFYWEDCNCAEAFQCIATANFKTLTVSKKNNRFTFSIPDSTDTYPDYIVMPLLQTENVDITQEETVKSISYNALITVTKENNLSDESTRTTFQSQLVGTTDSNGYCVINLNEDYSLTGASSITSVTWNSSQLSSSKSVQLYRNKIVVSDTATPSTDFTLTVGSASYNYVLKITNPVKKRKTIVYNTSGVEIELKDNFAILNTTNNQTYASNWLSVYANNRDILSVKCRIDPRLDLLDKIDVYDVEDRRYQIIVTEFDYDLNGTFYGTIKGRVISQKYHEPTSDGGEYIEEGDWYFMIYNPNQVDLVCKISTLSPVQVLSVTIPALSSVTINAHNYSTLNDAVEYIMNGTSPINSIDLYFMSDNNDETSSIASVDETWFE